MKFRSLILLGFCASLALNSPAFAVTPQIDAGVPVAAAQGNVIDVAISKTDPKAKKSASAKSNKKIAKKGKGAKKLTPEEQAIADKLAAKQAKEAEKQAKIAAKKKADEVRMAAKAKADKERQVAKAKAAAERQQAAEARAKAYQDKQLAKAKALEDARQAKIRAAEEQRLAIARAEKARRDAELAQLASLEVTKTGNNSELRSEAQAAPPPRGLFASLFGGSIKQQSMLPETRALDAVLEQKQARKAFKVKSEFEPQEVDFSGYPSGTIVIDTGARFLYLVDGMSSARRYAIAVGREGLQYKGNVKVGDKQEWPRWIPTLDMQKREPKHYGQYKDGMPGGPDNPLGARAIYLYDGKKDTHLRIHGTNQPQSIGTSASNGCFRMINEHVMDLYKRVGIGTNVVVL